MLHPRDRRQIDCQADPEAIAEIEELRDPSLEQDLRLARLFHRVARKKAHKKVGAPTVEEFGRRRGYDPGRVRELTQAGYALDGEPRLEALLRANRVTFGHVILLGRIYRDPEKLLEPDDDWAGWASGMRIGDLRDRVRARIESVRQGHKTRSYVVHLAAPAHRSLVAARRIAMRKARRPLTNGQVIWAACEALRDKLEPPGFGQGVRRLPHTAFLPDERRVPNEVKRKILDRSDGLCEFGGCHDPIVELCHIDPHREGGHREVENLVGGCLGCHPLFDGGELEFVGHMRDYGLGTDRAIFREAATGKMLWPKPSPKPLPEVERPDWMLKILGAKRKPRTAKPGRARKRSNRRERKRRRAEANRSRGSP